MLVQPAPTPPQVVSTSPAAGATLTQLPTQVVVTFDQPMNLAQLALQQYQVSSQDNISAVYIEGADGTQYPLRLDSYDAATDTATFDLLDALPDGNYQLHLSGAAGLTDLGGNPLVGNDPSGDYVVPFTVDAPRAATGGTRWSGATRSPMTTSAIPRISASSSRTSSRPASRSRAIPARTRQAPQDTADVYQFQVLLDRVYAVTLVGEQVPPGVTLSLTVTTPSGQIVLNSWPGSPTLDGELVPGTYLLVVNGWDSSQAADVSYQVSLTMITQDDNAPPLVSGPAPAVAIQLDSVAPPTLRHRRRRSRRPSPRRRCRTRRSPRRRYRTRRSPRRRLTTPPVVTPPVTDTPVASPPLTDAPPVGTPSGGTDPSSTAAAPAVLAIAIPPQPEAIPTFTGASPLSLVALASSSVGGLTGAEESQASPTALVQNASAAQSSLATGLIIVSTSFPLLGPGEGVVAAPVGPEAVEGPMTDVESSPADTASTRSPEGESLIPAPVDDLFEIRVLSPPLPSDPEAAAAAAPLPVAVVAGPTSEVPPVAVAGRSARSDEDPGRSDRGPGRAFILAFTGLALGAYTRCRTLARRDVRRDEGRSVCRAGAGDATACSGGRDREGRSMSERPGPEDMSRTWRLGSPGPSSADDRSPGSDRLAEQPEGRAADLASPPGEELEPGPTDPGTGDGEASLLVAEIFQRRGPAEPPGSDAGRPGLRARPDPGLPGEAPGASSTRCAPGSGPRTACRGSWPRERSSSASASAINWDAGPSPASISPSSATWPAARSS